MKNSFLIPLVSLLFSSFLVEAQYNPPTLDSSYFMINYIDSLFNSNMKEMHIPGAVISIVKDGKIVFNKGYGFADIESGRKVNPEKSVFRMASISKPFTAIAILKLVEQGKLKLHQDIRPLIAERYEFNWEYPLSIHQILTHTTGIDYSSIGSHKSEGEFLDPKKKIKMLNQGHKPGDHFAYSNAAFGLLGYLIEQKSGQSYHAYMKENILDPLQMTNSTFNTTLPSSIETHKTETYHWSNGINKKQVRQHLGVPAASSLESTGGDMAKFMTAILNPIMFEELGIISLKSFNKMTTPQLSEITDNTMGYAFFLGTTKNNSSIYHSGGVRGFLSVYNVFPSEKLGIFISQSNRPGAEYFSWNINSKLYEKLLPDSKQDLSWVQKQDKRSILIDKFEGVYSVPSHRNSTFEKGEILMASNEVRIKVLSDTTLSFFGKTFKRIGNTTFVNDKENSEWVIQFRQNEQGEIIRMVNNVQTYFKIKWYERIVFTQVLTGLCFLIFVFVFFQLTKSFFTSNTNKFSLEAIWIHCVSTGYLLSFSSLLIAYFIVETIKEGVPLGFKIPIIGITLCGLFTLAFPWAVYKTIASSSNLRSKIWNLMSIAAIIFVTILFFNLNLIGFKW